MPQVTTVTELWFCQCGRHSYSLLFVSNAHDPEEERCGHCRGGPIKLWRSTRYPREEK